MKSSSIIRCQRKMAEMRKECFGKDPARYVDLRNTWLAIILLRKRWGL